jgi:hypothetical protein
MFWLDLGADANARRAALEEQQVIDSDCKVDTSRPQMTANRIPTLLERPDYFL